MIRLYTLNVFFFKHLDSSGSAVECATAPHAPKLSQLQITNWGCRIGDLLRER